MTGAALIFASTFVAVFALGFQSLNVNQGRYGWAAITSLAIGISTMHLYRAMPGANPVEIAGYLAGGVIGITSSMYFHRRVTGAWRRILERLQPHIGWPHWRGAKPPLPVCLVGVDRCTYYARGEQCTQCRDAQGSATPHRAAKSAQR